MATSPPKTLPSKMPILEYIVHNNSKILISKAIKEVCMGNILKKEIRIEGGRGIRT